MNVFIGENSLQDFLNPSNIFTPLVELPSSLNTFIDRNVRIFIKLMSHTSLFNIKHVTVYSMLARTRIAGKRFLVESSSGNTALTLSILAKYFGYKKTKFFFSHRVPIGKLNLIKLLADEIEVNKEPLCPDKKDPNSSINKAKSIAQESDFLNLDQYSNPANPQGHFEVTGQQILEQFEYANLHVDYLFAAVGTTGTIVGTSLKLRERFPSLKTIGVASADDMVRLGARSKNLLEEIDFEWKSHVDDLVEVDVQTAFVNSINLVKSGILVGPSTGHIFGGILKYVGENNVNNANIVFVSCDTFLPYVEEYIKYLPSEYMASVINEDLALNYAKVQAKLAGRNYMDYRIEADVFIERYRNLDNNSICIDIRKDSEYSAFRLQNVERIHEQDLEDETVQSSIINNLKSYNSVYVIDCGMSDMAKLLSLILRQTEVNAYWVDGGMDYISKNWPELIVR
ncbi:MAG: hypothetical protein KatS3mg084_0412 [Candidatus Dojkabacteria bacterium]|nr:MAG: hypothetical protein KatS3mg084_0412 [Candidatus Dojkabacteria bacterium]